MRLQHKIMNWGGREIPLPILELQAGRDASESTAESLAA